MGKHKREEEKRKRRAKRLSSMPEWKRFQRTQNKKKHMDSDWKEPKNKDR